jgi:2',3'-cyclic-nucleotide 2'-phosphodiesterase (5'-nucleotidase family)
VLYSLLAGFLALACTSPYTFVSKPGLHPVGAELRADSLAEASIAPYQQQLQAMMDEVIGTASADIPRNMDEAESHIGNFCADLMLEQARKLTEADLAVVTVGGLRVPIGQGPITVGLIFELMPFENELVVLDVKGDSLRPVFERITGKKNVSIANAVATFRRGEWVSAEIGGQPFDPNKTYRVVVSDYLASGGDYMPFLKDAPQTFLNVKVRDAIIQHIREQTAAGNTIQAAFGDRVRFED